MIGRSAGEATSEKLFGLIEIGDKISVNGDFKMVSSSSEDDLEKEAAFHAVMSRSGDVFTRPQPILLMKTGYSV